MLGPNKTPLIHHREPAFEELYKNLCNTFKLKFNISNDFIVLPITGSGTLSLEILLNGLDLNLIHKNTEEEFGKRLEMLNRNDKGTSETNDGIAFVQYETSISKLNNFESNKVKIVDAVSSFPYYNIPEDTDAWVTVNSKQLGCNPGLSFIVLNKSLLPKVKKTEFSYLSLGRYLDYAKVCQTPNTPAIGLMQETLDMLINFNIVKFRNKINKRRQMLELTLGSDGACGPVLTYDTLKFDIKERFNLYGKNNTQIFLWSGKNNDYKTITNYITQKGSI